MAIPSFQSISPRVTVLLAILAREESVRGNDTGRAALIGEVKNPGDLLTLALKENLLDVHGTPHMILSCRLPMR